MTAELKLTEDEKQAAEKAGMTEERYAALKGVENLRDWMALQQREAARDGGAA